MSKPECQKTNTQEIKDALRFCRIRQKDLRKQSKRLHKVHLRDYLIKARVMKQSERTKGIEQTINREHNGRMWYLITRMAKDPHSPPVTKVQKVVNGKVQTYDTQPGVEKVIQKECEV